MTITIPALRAFLAAASLPRNNCPTPATPAPGLPDAQSSHGTALPRPQSIAQRSWHCHQPARADQDTVQPGQRAAELLALPRIAALTCCTLSASRLDDALISQLLDLFPHIAPRDIKMLLRLALRMSQARQLTLDAELFRQCAMFRDIAMQQD